MTASRKEDVALRRVPTQARSRRRFEAILDAAATEFGEAGFEAATTEAIAARAQTSIGSLYQFFPNKLALFQAVADRCLERCEVLFAQLFPADAPERPWPELLDAAIDGFAELQRTDPGFQALSMNLQLWGLYAEADNALHREFVHRVEALMAAAAPDLAPRRRRVVANTVVQVVSGTLFYAGWQEAAFAQAMLEEAKVLLRRYLESYTDSKGTSPRTKKRRKTTTP